MGTSSLLWSNRQNQHGVSERARRPNLTVTGSFKAPPRHSLRGMRRRRGLTSSLPPPRRTSAAGATLTKPMLSPLPLRQQSRRPTRCYFRRPWKRRARNVRTTRLMISTPSRRRRPQPMIMSTSGAISIASFLSKTSTRFSFERIIHPSIHPSSYMNIPFYKLLLAK